MAERLSRRHGPLGDGRHAAMFCSDPSRPRQILPVRGLLHQEALVEAVNTHHALHLSHSQSRRLHLCGRASRLLKLNSRATAPVSPILFTFRVCHELSHVQQWTERASGRFRWCFFKVSKHVRTHLKQAILKQQRPDDAPKPSKPTTETRAATKSHQPHLHSLGFGCVVSPLAPGRCQWNLRVPPARRPGGARPYRHRGARLQTRLW